MKRTTYILIGLFVAGLCVLVGGMFMIFCLGRPYISNQLNLQGEQITKEVPACRVVWLTQQGCIRQNVTSGWRILFWKCSLQKKGRICFLARRR